MDHVSAPFLQVGPSSSGTIVILHQTSQLLCAGFPYFIIMSETLIKKRGGAQ